MRLAASDRRCWNLYCTTCGHQEFRYGFKALAMGLHPADPSWPVSKNQSTRHRRVEQLGRRPLYGDWGLGEQAALQAAVVGCRMERIVSDANFPDRLGYLGLLLNYTSGAEAEEPRITRSLVPQLLPMMAVGSSGEALLRERRRADERLTVSDLEELERSFGSTGFLRTTRKDTGSSSWIALVVSARRSAW